jgi:RHS repeat-associated protein
LAWNSLTDGTDGSVVSFKYDPFGRRIEKSSPAGTTIYVYDGDNIEEELNGTGAVQERYTYGPGIDEPLVGQREPKIFYYEADGLGSVTSLTDPTGAIAATYTYDSFGFLTASTGSATNWYRYTARQFDSDTALYYYRARYYDPTTGRFLSEDLIGFDSDTDFYRYAENDPLSRVDPSGLSSLVFDRASGTLAAYDSQGNLVATYSAGNFTINPGGNPNTIGANGPAPNGTFPVLAPVNTAGDPRYGPYFFPVGAPGSIIRKRGIGIHGGRRGPISRTLGCIRVSNETDQALYLLYQKDPITQITIK